MEPRHLISQPVNTDDHCGRDIGRLEKPAPPRDPLTVSGEDDSLCRFRWDIDRHLSATVVSKRLGDQFSRYWVGIRWFRRRVGTALARSCLVTHVHTSSLEDCAANVT